MTAGLSILIVEDEPAHAEAIRRAFQSAEAPAMFKIVATLKLLHDQGTFIVPGTDTGGSFTYHRELELYQSFGMTAPEILKRATWDMAAYTGQDQTMARWRYALAIMRRARLPRSA